MAFFNLRWQDFLDILIVAFLIYRILLLLVGTRAMQLIRGLMIIGLIGAAALMRPSKSVSDMEVKSLKKKFKDKKFAAGCHREVIAQGAEMLGWTLDELFEKTIAAMRVDEAKINDICAGFEKQ